MKKLSKILSIVMVVLMLVCASTSVFAVNIDNMMNTTLNSSTTSNMQKIGGTIIAFITNTAMIIAVVIIAVLGVKYMIGSAEEKAEYKKSMLPYLIGAVLVFGASTIAKVITSISF